MRDIDALLRFEAELDMWVLDFATEPRGALVAAKVGGLRWIVSSLDPSTPQRVEIDADPSPWTLAAVASLLGQDAVSALGEQEIDRSTERPVEVDETVTERFLAMGMLAVATTGRRDSPLWSLDVAALLHRAALDELSEPLPDWAELLADAEEAIFLLPPAAYDLLRSSGTPDTAAEAIARRGLADAQAFTAAVSGDPLAGRDVRREFDQLVAEWTVVDEGFRDLLAQLELTKTVPSVFLGGVDAQDPPHPETPSNEPPGHRRSIDVRVVDLGIIGVVGASATLDPQTATLEVKVRTRPGAPALFARLVEDGTRRVLDVARVESPAGSIDGSVVLAVEASLPVRVELLTRTQQPVTDLVTAAQVDRSYRMLEAQRMLRQLAVAAGDGDLAALGQRNTVEQLRRLVSAADAALLSDAKVEPLPSDALAAVLAELGDSILDATRSVELLTERAANAHNLVLLLRESALPAAQRLVAELSLVAADALAGGSSADLLNARDAAVTAAESYESLGDREGAARARRIISDLSG